MKTKYKIVLAIMLIFCTAKSFAQFPEITNAFLDIRIDTKMAIVGPFQNKVNDTNGGKLNIELALGWEYNAQRFGYAYELFPHLQYQKHSIFFEHKFTNSILGIIKVRNITTYVGPELGLIIRKFNIKKTTTDWLQLGANLSFMYTINDTVQIGMQYNVFRGEEDYRNTVKTLIQQFRKDLMLTTKINF